MIFFWEVATQSTEDYEKAIQMLSQKSLSMILDFEEFLAQKLYALDRKKWAESIYGEESISKDDFLYVRCYVVAQGKTFYEKVLAGEIEIFSFTFEPLLYVAEKAFFQKTNTEFPACRTSVSYETGSNGMYWS